MYELEWTTTIPAHCLSIIFIGITAWFEGSERVVDTNTVEEEHVASLASSKIFSPESLCCL